MPKRIILILSLLAAIMVMPAIAPGADQQPQNPKYVVSIAMYEDNQTVQALIGVADKLVENGEIAEAIETYQQALEDTLDNNPSALIEVQESAADKLIYCRPCLEVIRDRMARMSVEDIAVYREKYEYATERMVNKAVENRDMATVFDIGRRRPYTVAGIRAAQISASVAMENCDYALAANICVRALEIVHRYPDIFGGSGPARAAFYALAAEACAASENKIGLDRVVAAIAENKALGDEKIRINGERIALADYVNDAVKRLTIPATPVTPGYPMLGGDNARAEIMSGRGGIGAQKWHYEVKYADKDFYGRQQKIYSDILIAPVPTADSGRIYLDTGYGMVVVSEYDGAEVFGATLANPAQERVREHVQENLDSCTVRENIAYFVETVGSTNLDITHQERVKLPNFRRLVAVDTQTGKRRWDTDVTTKLDRYDYVCGSPALYRDTILFQVMRHDDVTDYYDMLCVDALSGELRWRIPLVTKAAGEAAYNYQRRSPNIIAIKGDTAIATSSAGTVTAIDLASRAIKWGTKFHNDTAAHRGGERTGDYRVEAGADCSNQPMLLGDNVILKPSESRRLYCLDIETGKLRWLIEHPTIAYVAGVDGDTLYAVGPGVKEIDIKDGSIIFEEDYPVEDKEYRREMYLMAGTHGRSGFKGRPALTREGLYISTVESLFRFDRKTRKLEKLFDWADRDLLPGNLLMTENGFYVANSDGITAFYTPAAIDVVTRLLEKTPGDPELLYRRGMTQLGFGQSAEALKDLELAEKNAGPQRMLNGRLLSDLIREGLMESCIVQARQDSAAGSHDAAMRAAARAVDYAARPSEKIEALCVLATVQQTAGVAHVPAAVASWQRIVEECPNELAAFGENFTRTAALYAVENIAADIQKHGRAVYAEVEKRAADELAAATTADDFRRILARYPNSLAAFGAIERIAADSAGLAMALMTPIIGRCDASTETAPHIANMYRLAWACGESRKAEDMLDMLARLPAGASMTVDGAQVSVADFVKTRRDELNAIKANDPVHARFPADAVLDETVLKASPAITDKRFSHVSFVVPSGPRPGIMKNRILLKNSGYVYCVDTDTGNILWQNPGTVRLWLGMSIAVAKTGDALQIEKIFPNGEAEKAGLKAGDLIVSLNARKADSIDVWRAVLDGAKNGDKIQVEYIRSGNKAVVALSARPLPPELAAQQVRDSIFSARYVGGDRIVVISAFPTTTARCVDLATGRTLWQSGGYVKWPNRSNAGLLVTNGLFVGCAESMTGSKVSATRLVAVDAQTGKTVARIEIDGAIEQCALAGDMFLARRDNVCTAYGILDGQKRYEFKLRKILDSSQRDYVDGFRVAADRILIYPDLNDRLRSIDLWSGSNVCEPAAVFGGKLIFNSSERYVMVNSYMATFNYVREKNVVHLFDGAAATGKTELEFNAPVDSITIVGDRIFSHGPREWTRYFAAYDIKTGAMSQSMTIAENNNRHYDFKHCVGEYVIVGVVREVAASAAPPAVGHEISVVVFDATGKEYFRYTTPTELRGMRIEGFVADGRLYLVMDKSLYVFKAPK